MTIGGGQTISQPYIVARMSEALQLGPAVEAGHRPRVLEIGTETGYQAAVLARMGATVVTVERDTGLADEARGRLADLGFRDVRSGARRRQYRLASGRAL